MPLNDDDIRVCTLLRHIRRQYNYYTYVNVKLYKPICHGCKHAESRFMERHTSMPNVFPETWCTDYQEYGVTAYRVRVLKKIVQEGEWSGPDCYHCGTLLSFTEGEPFFVNSGSLEDYFVAKVAKGRKPQSWMKDILFEVYRGRCAACRRQLSPRTITYDHIVPRQHGGRTALDNLQPLCSPCNQQKSNQSAKEVDWGSLVFPLLPPNERLWIR